MKLTGQQFKNLAKAIQGAFSYADLDQLMKFELNEQLANIVAGGALATVVFDLITWSEQHGRTKELVVAVQQARTGNQEIQHVTQELLKPLKAAPAPTGAKVFDGPRRARLRGALIAAFPSRSDLGMLLDSVLSTPLDEVAGEGNLTATANELVQWLNVDVEARLRPLLEAAVEQRPNSAELRALNQEMFGA